MTFSTFDADSPRTLIDELLEERQSLTSIGATRMPGSLLPEAHFHA